jgi:aminopeptidase N
VHFKQVFGVLEAFEHYLAPYPFWRDGYALIETPYLGMEHQSGIAYGNNFMRGYLGSRIPFDMNWDYIIVHETGHEWWGNAVSAKDHAEIWIHESFTTYLEALYVEYHFGYEDMIRYLKGQRRHVNKTPIVGPLHVNYGGWAGSDEYYKGSWIIHTFRHIIGDEKFFSLLKAFYNKFEYQTITTRDFLDFVNSYTSSNYDLFFNQYLYTPDIPKLLYSIKEEENGLSFMYKWEGCLNGFNMPVTFSINKEIKQVECSDKWQDSFFAGISKKDFEIMDELMLIDKKKYRQ